MLFCRRMAAMAVISPTISIYLLAIEEEELVSLQQSMSWCYITHCILAYDNIDTRWKVREVRRSYTTAHAVWRLHYLSTKCSRPQRHRYVASKTGTVINSAKILQFVDRTESRANTVIKWCWFVTTLWHFLPSWKITQRCSLYEAFF